MNFYKFSLVLFLLFSGVFARAQKQYVWKQGTAAGYTYKYVTNDPMQTRFYTLKNGLTVILTVNHKEPRINVSIPVRAGSNTDPRDHTGLAHYLEHVLFKGTDKYGTQNYAKEKPYLDRIDSLYEVYNSTKDDTKRKVIYKEIDKVSGEAAKISIANEYDKLMADIGSQGSNAYTSVEQTVYIEDVPSSSLDKFLAVQAERFHHPVFRIFHTELEAVYEEKNRSLDDDRSKMEEAMMYYLFPTHNYGQQTTIGTIEHLKNPSLKAIDEYYHKYYVPNNMAIIMAGDFDPDVLIKKIDNSFSYMKNQPVSLYNPAPEKSLTAPVVQDILGPNAENMRICYRTPAANTRDALVLDLISSIFFNGKAGLLDLNLNKQQKVQSAGAGLEQLKDYGVLRFIGTPKQGQTLEQVKDLLTEQIEQLKKGNFDESLIKAIVANSKLSLLRGLESNANRVGNLTDAFVISRGEKWDVNVRDLEEQAKVTKKEIVDVANRYMKDNYVLLYKRKGVDSSIVKVDKPPITPVETNAGKQSDFVKKIEAMPVSAVEPQWLDYQKGITRAKDGAADILYVQNKDNELFRLYYRFDMGSWNNKVLPIAAQYLQFLGTDKYSSEDISKAFYNLASNFSIGSAAEVSTISVSGLQENFDKAVALFEDLLANCKPDEAALEALKGRLLKARINNKLNKTVIMQGLRSYAQYGSKNPFNDVLSNDEINNLKAADLVNLLHNLPGYKHTIIYYGPSAVEKFTTDITRLHKLPASFTAYPQKTPYTFTNQTANQVLFADYDMVQSEIFWVRNTIQYDPAKEPVIDLFNNYFGGNMSAVVFQTLRESKALAYSTSASYITPSRKENPFSVVAYIGSQSDKMNDALQGMNELLNDLPASDQGFENARRSLKNDLETQRITQDGIIFSYLADQQKGLDHDIRKDEYAVLDKLTMEDIKNFHKENLANKAFTYCIVASDKRVKMEDLKKLGDVKKLSLEEIFGY